MQNSIRIGVVGVGGMGGGHARNLVAGKISRATLGAVCDVNPAHFGNFPGVPSFTDFEQMLDSGAIDAVVIATPHYFHTTQGILALERGIPTLTEKPISVSKADAEKMIVAWEKHKPVFAAMFDHRTIPVNKKLRQLLHDGTLGELRRVTWIVTDWFRSEAYYQSGGWRATWGGEGGGILVNQCPHNLDIFQWVFGMPKSVTALCKIGKYHDIEVEDEFHALFDFDNNATASLIATTGEAPGTNRLELATENGCILVENERLVWHRTDEPVTQFSRTTTERMSAPPSEQVIIETPGGGGRHNEVLANFVDAILDGAPLIAPAPEGLRSVELANAILYSSFERRTVDLPLDSAVYQKFLEERIAGSRFQFGK
ncbi:putative oxidoreductase YteT [Abditibacteriota bacterium]|nr:putative oxidoreductase YteT [Abditibacteriota bacterium]